MDTRQPFDMPSHERKLSIGGFWLTNKGEVVFEQGQLVQVYHSDLDYTFKTERKILPKWSQPHRISKRLRNSYELENLDGSPISGTFSARRLQAFIPREGTKLAVEQRELERKLAEETDVDKLEETHDAEDEEVEDEADKEEDGDGSEEEDKEQSD
jgi:hypothetical protein